MKPGTGAYRSRANDRDAERPTSTVPLTASRRRRIRGRRNQEPARRHPGGQARYSTVSRVICSSPQERRRREDRPVRRHELRIEGDHEDRAAFGLASCTTTPSANDPHHRRRPGWPASSDGAAARLPARRPQGPEPEDQQDGGADHPEDQVGHLGRRDQRGEPDAGEQRPQVEAQLEPEHGRHRATQAAQRRPAEDQRHRRPGEAEISSTASTKAGPSEDSTSTARCSHSFPRVERLSPRPSGPARSGPAATTPAAR